MKKKSKILGVLLSIVMVYFIWLFLLMCSERRNRTLTPSKNEEPSEIIQVHSPSSSKKSSITKQKMTICPRCKGQGIYEVMPGDLMAPREVCSLCSGTGVCSEKESNKYMRMKRDIDNFLNENIISDPMLDLEEDLALKEYKCSLCGGDGKCFSCGGRGEHKYDNGIYGVKEVDCDYCHGNGKCKNCFGEGTIWR